MEYVSDACTVVIFFDDGCPAAVRTTAVAAADVRCLRTRMARRVKQPQSCARQADPRSGDLDSRGARNDAARPRARERRVADAVAVPGRAAIGRGASTRAAEPL